MFKQLFFALFAGLVCTIFIMQNDQHIKDTVIVHFTQLFEEALDCKFKGHVRCINFFYPSLELEDIEVCSRKEQQWSWKCKQYTTWFSWWNFLCSGTIDLHIMLNQLEARSDMHNGIIAIMDHIQRIMEEMSLDIPIALKSLVLYDASLYVCDPIVNINALVKWNSELKDIDGIVKSSIHFLNGNGVFQGETCFADLGGSIQLEARDHTHIVLHSNCMLTVPQLKEHNSLCFLTGYWDKDQGFFTLRNTDDSLVIDPISLMYFDNNFILECNARFPLESIRHLLGKQIADSSLKGTCSLQAKIDLNDMMQGVHGHMNIHDLRYNQFSLGKSHNISFSRKGTQWNGRIHLSNDNSFEIRGTWNWCEDMQKGHVALANNLSFLLPKTQQWSVMPGDFSAHIDIDQSTGISGTYRCDVTHTKLDSHIPITGNCMIDENQAHAYGQINQKDYELECVIKPTIRLTKFIYKDEKGMQLASINAHSPDYNKLEGSIYFPFIRSLLLDTLHYDVQGDGFFNIYSVLGNDQIVVKIQFIDGNIRLPQTYNFIGGLDATFVLDIPHNKIVMKNMFCALHKGTVKCHRATACFDDYGSLTFAYVPLLFDQCLLNVKKDLFTIVSGSILVIKQDNELPLLKGHLFLERSQLKENPFSTIFQKNLFQTAGSTFDVDGTDIACDITIATKDPIRIKTAFLETNAQVRMKIKQSMRDPYISGSIDLLAGSMNFPYKSLNIIKGSLYFVPYQPYDPIIELIAKNKIKQYNVSLQVTGSLQNHHIMVASTPSLTEEQIVTLLLVGSQEDSLNIMAPALIMNNVKQLIFGSDQSLLTLNRYNNILKPFKHIHVVPSFSDQTGRGGLRGAIEIDVHDRWRALIQKNFSLSEDTRLELEYFLSDDISIRGIRDERRDVSGEIEMRWKF